MRWPTTLLAALLFALLAPASARAVGEPTQKPGTAGCISETGSGGMCQDGVSLDAAAAVAISPDGRNVYVGGFGAMAGVAVFDRNTTTGTLTQKPGAAGCLASSGAPCALGTYISRIVGIAVSPDGRSVYAVNLFGDAVLAFDRNAANGELTQKAGTAGCIQQTGLLGCTDGRGLLRPSDVAVSADGSNVYVASQFGDTVAVFDRDTTTGALTQKAGAAGCIAQAAGDGCAVGKALDTPIGVSVTAGNVYVASSGSDAVAVFDRGAGGALTQKAGTAGCVSETGSGGQCQDGVALDGAQDLAVSPDGANLYVASVLGDAVAAFDRGGAGGLSQKPDQAGCISETGSGGQCRGGFALNAAKAIALSADGSKVYVGAGDSIAGGSNALTSFDRAPATGALTQPAGPAGCVSETGTGDACQDGVALDNLDTLAVSPDRRGLYTAAQVSGAVGIFDLAQPSGGPGTTPPDGADTEPPVVSGFRLSNRRFRVGPRRTPLVASAPQRRRRVPRGTAFRFSLSERAAVGIAIERGLPGRRVRGRCRAPSRSNRARRRCTRYRHVGRLSRRGRPAGRNAIRFSGRLGRKALVPGVYRATLLAVDEAGNRSRSVRRKFRVLRR